MNRNAVTAGIATAALLGLVGCSSGGGSETPTVRKARLDDVKHVAAKKAVTQPATRMVTDYRNECKTKTRTKRVNGKTITETYQDCNRVSVGTHQESYTRTVKAAKPAKWCVELDDVNGKRDQDDEWFTVSHRVYTKWADRNEGSKVKRMEYIRKGC